MKYELRDMKKNMLSRLSLLAVIVLPMLFTSCADYFETNPDNIMKDNEYIGSEDEMYKGFLGIFNRMQEAGDQSIFLTDTRCNFLEVTDRAPVALQEIYSYDNTDGNEYADPTCYYSIIIACNDYFDKMQTYHHNVGGMSESAETHFKALISSAIRIKVWAYYMLGRIYGQAYWFDDPLREKTPLTNTDVFTHCDMQTLTAKCLSLLDSGLTIDGVAVTSDLTMNWYEWLDEENQNASSYVKWQYLTPPLILLQAELRSWKCNYETEDAAQTDWLWIRDNLLKYLYGLHNASAGSAFPYAGWDISSTTTSDYNVLGWMFQTNVPLQSDYTGAYFNIFSSEEVGNKYQLASGIMYDYNNHQRNRLVQYFCPSYPSQDAFYLQPSEYGKSLYPETDIRSLTQKMVMNNINGTDALTKYYYKYNQTTRTYKYLRDNIFQIEPTIITFRGHDFHFLLAEAENHLGNWDQASTILNKGLMNRFASKILPTDSTWSAYYNSWFAPRGGYGDVGIVGAANGKTYNLPTPNDSDYNLTENQRKQVYDWALADEYLKEYTAEGKSYSYLCKMAERWSNADRGTSTAAREKFADRIAPKYKTSGLQQKVRAYLEGTGYWIQWNLK